MLPVVVEPSTAYWVLGGFGLEIPFLLVYVGPMGCIFSEIPISDAYTRDEKCPIRKA
jgi:hypothetical protein